MSTFGILVLLAGIGILGYGIWLYHQAANSFDFASARAVVENGETPMAIWIGGAMIIGGAVAMMVGRNRRR